MKEASKFLGKLKNIKRIDVLPYHTLGKAKWDECKLKYKLAGVNPPSEASIKVAKEILGA